MWLGGAMFLLMDDPKDWVHRRVETVSFLDASSIRRKVSVDFDVPGVEARPAQGPALVPLALLEKRPLVNLDVRDESGASCPVLNAEENGFVTWSLLTRVAYQAVFSQLEGRPLPGHILDDLRVLAGAPAGEAAAKLEEIGCGLDPELRKRLELPLFKEYAESLATRFLLITELADDQRKRRVLKFSYTTQLEKAKKRRRERGLGMLGWTATQFDVGGHIVGEGQSYHVEFEGPPGLDVERAELFCADPLDTLDEGRLHSAQVVGSRAHMYASDEDLGVEGISSVWLRPPRPGLLRSSLVTAFVIVSVFFWFDDRIIDQGNRLAIPLLLIAPGLVASFIIRPGEHGLVTDLLAGVRAAIGLAALAAYAGAIAVAGGVSDSSLMKSWRILGIVAVVCFISLCVAYWQGARETEEEVSNGQESQSVHQAG